MVQYQVLQTKIMTVVWQTVRRITFEIFGLEGLGHSINPLQAENCKCLIG